MQVTARCVGFIETKTSRLEGPKLRREPLGAIVLIGLRYIFFEREKRREKKQIGTRFLIFCVFEYVLVDLNICFENWKGKGGKVNRCNLNIIC